MDYKQLAAEREERLRAAGIDPSAPSGQKVAANPWGSERAPRQAQARTSTLFEAHRSVRMAHSIGLIVCMLVLPLLLLPWVTVTKVILLGLMASAVWLARSGGTWLHNSVLSPMLREGNAPTEQEIAAHDLCLFAPRFSAEAFNEEWQVAVENLAWCCTYGKKNCITGAIYSQNEPLSVSKILRITWSKVSEGVFRCN